MQISLQVCHFFKFYSKILKKNFFYVEGIAIIGRASIHQNVDIDAQMRETIGIV